ncbi:hypothetical protein Pfo_017582 [Paulownia fortunei]|nr:hypothetical protein Pfo_017582 [Paulownia fortunei]
MSNFSEEESVGSSEFHHLTTGDQVSSKPHHGSPTGSEKFQEANESPTEHSYPICLNIVPFEPVPELDSEQPRNNERRRYKGFQKSAEPSRKPSHKKTTSEEVQITNVPGQQRQGYSALRMRADNDPAVVRKNMSASLDDSNVTQAGRNRKHGGPQGDSSLRLEITIPFIHKNVDEEDFFK